LFLGWFCLWVVSQNILAIEIAAENDIFDKMKKGIPTCYPVGDSTREG
jgi:hypothetical protein